MYQFTTLVATLYWQNVHYVHLHVQWHLQDFFKKAKKLKGVKSNKNSGTNIHAKIGALIKKKITKNV